MHSIAKVDPEVLDEQGSGGLVKVPCGKVRMDGYVLAELEDGSLLVDLASGFCPKRRQPVPAADLDWPEGVEILTEGPLGGPNCRRAWLPEEYRDACRGHDWMR